MKELDARDGKRVRWHQLEIGEVFSRLGTQREGLSSQEASRRLEEYGPNELLTEERALPIAILIRQIQSPLIYILIVAGLVTALLGRYVDTGVILSVVVLNSVVGFIQEYKAEQSLRALRQMTAPRARVVRDGQAREIDAREVVPGDVVLLESGTKVPADLRLFRTTELQVDESILTGESLPTFKTPDSIADPNAPLGDLRNMAFMGTIIVRGRGAGVVVGTGVRTVFGLISVEVRGLGEVKSPLQARLAGFAGLIAYIVLGVTLLVFALGLLAGERLAEIFLTAVATAVATVPEGLPVTITVALAVGVWRMAQRRAIVRKLPVVETLGSCTTICSDKTGTLTKNEMTVARIYAGGQTFEITGVGYAPEGKVLLDGRQVNPVDYPALELALRIGMLSSEASVYLEDGRYRVDGDPTEAALVVAATKAGLCRECELKDYPVLDEIPFESERRYTATLHGHDGERLIFVKGAPERILEMCNAVYAYSTVAVDKQSVLQESHELASQGLRVLAMAYRQALSGTNESKRSMSRAG